MFWVHKWWHNSTTTSAMRDQFRSLVHAGQIEFLNGGWVMQDDTVSHWEADIAQVNATHTPPSTLLPLVLFDLRPSHQARTAGQPGPRLHRGDFRPGVHSPHRVAH